MKTKILTLLTTLAISSVSMAQIINVPGDQPTIQAGIDAATDYDTVLVDTGTWYENINFNGKAITVASQHIMDGDTTHINNTIIDGGMAANPDSASVVYFINGEDTLSVIHGFTIQGGKGTKDGSWRGGGGILCFSSGPKIEHNIIKNNECNDDGGYATGGGINIVHSTNSIPIIRDNDISNNACYKNISGTGVAYGGGISVEDYGDGYECLIENNIISDNQCSNEVPDSYAIGGGIYVDYVKAVIRNNNIINNEVSSTDTYWSITGGGIGIYRIKEGSTISGNLIADNVLTAPWSYGGGLIIFENSGTVYVDRNIFEGNEAKKGAGVGLEYDKDVIFTNNVLKGNIAETTGGGICIQDQNKKQQGYPKNPEGAHTKLKSNSNTKDTGIPVIANNTFIENIANFNFMGMSIHTEAESTPLVAFNNIFYNLGGGNGSEIYISESGCNAYLYNNLLDTENNILCYGEWEGADNFYANPELSEDNIHLLGSSPCINTGTNALEINGTTYFCPDYDIDGEARPLNGQAEIGADEKLYGGIVDLGYKQGDPSIEIFPNPFTVTTNIKFNLQSAGQVELSLFDFSGRKVRALINNNLQAGIHEIKIDLSDLKPGIYFCTLKTNPARAGQTRKLIKVE